MIIRHVMNHDCGAVLVKKRRWMALSRAHDGDASGEEFRLHSSVRSYIKIWQITIVRTVRIAETMGRLVGIDVTCCSAKVRRTGSDSVQVDPMGSRRQVPCLDEDQHTGGCLLKDGPAHYSACGIGNLGAGSGHLAGKSSSGGSHERKDSGGNEQNSHGIASLGFTCIW